MIKSKNSEKNPQSYRQEEFYLIFPFPPYCEGIHEVNLKPNKKNNYIEKIKNILSVFKKRVYQGIENFLINYKTVKWFLIVLIIGYHCLLLTGVIIAQWTPDWSAIDGFSIWDNWISDLGGYFFTPIPILFDITCILGGMVCILLTLSINIILRDNSLASIGTYIGIIGNCGYIGVGIFSQTRNLFGFMHGCFTVITFGGYIICAFCFGMCIIINNKRIPKKIGWYATIVPLTSALLFSIFRNPLCKWISNLVYHYLTSKFLLGKIF